MSISDYIPRREADFNNWSKSFIIYLINNAERLNIPAEVINSLQALAYDWETKYAVTEQPSMRTSVAIREKNEARDAFEKEIRMTVREYIAVRHEVTDADRQAMGIPIRKTSRTAAPVPATYPDATADTSVLRRISIHFRDAGANAKRKPAGVHGAEVKWAIANAKPELAQLANSSFSTTTPITLEFGESDRGKTLWFILRWENSRGMKGPWGELMNVIIP